MVPPAGPAAGAGPARLRAGRSCRPARRHRSGRDSGGTRLSDVRFLPLSAGRQAQKWTKIADLNIARWGRPSVGTIGGRITGIVLYCVAWSILCCSDRGLGRGESSELHRVLQRGCGRVGDEPPDPAVAGAALGGGHTGIQPTHPVFFWRKPIPYNLL